MDGKDAMTVDRRGEGGRFTRGESLTAEAGALLTTPLLPGWSLALDVLFA